MTLIREKLQPSISLEGVSTITAVTNILISGRRGAVEWLQKGLSSQIEIFSPHKTKIWRICMYEKQKTVRNKTWYYCNNISEKGLASNNNQYDEKSFNVNVIWRHMIRNIVLDTKLYMTTDFLSNSNCDSISLFFIQELLGASTLCVFLGTRLIIHYIL